MSSPLRPFRHAAALGLLAGAVMGAYHMAATAGSTVASLGEDHTRFPFFDIDPVLSALGRGYDLASLRNLQRTMDYVRGQYVDPKRIDPEAAFAGALDQVERTVPEALLRYDRKAERLQVAVGDHTDTLAVRKLTSLGDVTEELRRVAAILDAHLPASIERPEVEYALINGILHTLDPHSTFLPPERSQRMEEDNEGAFGGLGIQIALDKQRRLKVEIPLEDTPAWRAGLQAEDRIVQIDGEGTLNMDLDEAVRKMRGQPGTQVTLTVDREGFATPRDFTITRAKINQNEVWGRLLPGNVGYVRIDQFHGQVDTQLDAALQALQQKAGKGGLKGIVLDLRDNPGGFLHQAVAVVDRFRADGPIVSTRGRDGRGGDSEEATAGNEVPNVPVAVLTTGNSASASEIVAGALKNTDRAIVIGERTFGKGSVQNLYPFADTSRLKLTIAKYYTPGDHSIQGIGIAPDIALERAVVLPPKEFSYTERGVEKKETSGPRVSVYGRDRLQREADLEGHFDSTEAGEPPAAHTLRYLFVREEGERKVERQDVTKDAEVMIARDLIAASKGPTRADVLRAAGPVIAARAKAEEERIKGAFADPKVKIDWSACAAPATPLLDTRLRVGEDGALDAGQMETVTLEVQNRGNTPVCRVIGVAKGANPALDGVEFPIGRLAPGQTGTFAVRVRLADGYPTETSTIDVELRDDARRTLRSLEAAVPTRGVPLPSYAFSWTISDKEGGNGDGVLQVGETLALTLDVSNQGEGNGGVARFLLKKDAGMRKAVVLEKGEAKFPSMAAGADGRDVLRFRVAEAPEGGVVKLSLRGYDEDRYDYGTVEMGGFREWFDVATSLELAIGKPLPKGKRAPPRIRITRAPGATESGDEITISGSVSDETGVKDVILYAGDEKIAYEGGNGTVGQVPFSATTRLQEGVNVLVVLARDADGVTSSRAVPVFHPPKPKEAAAAGKPTNGDGAKP